MTKTDTTRMTLAIGSAVVAAGQAVAQTDSAAVDGAFTTLETYDWGADRNLLNPIDQAIVATQNDPAARNALEKRLVEALSGGLSRSAQDYVCRRLRVIGTAQSVDAPWPRCCRPRRPRTSPGSPWSAFPTRRRPRPCGPHCPRSAPSSSPA